MHTLYFGLWEEAVANPHNNKENMQTPQCEATVLITATASNKRRKNKNILWHLIYAFSRAVHI